MQSTFLLTLHPHYFTFDLLCLALLVNLGLTPPNEYTFAVYTQPGNAYHGIRPMPAVLMEDFHQSAPRGTGGYKVGGNYAPCTRWQGKARQMGYGLTPHLDSKTRRSEIEKFSTSGLVGVRREADVKTKLCIPDSTNIVDSVTSDSIATIAKSLGWTVEKRKVSIHFPDFTYSYTKAFRTNPFLI